MCLTPTALSRKTAVAGDAVERGKANHHIARRLSASGLMSGCALVELSADPRYSHAVAASVGVVGGSEIP